MYEWYPILIILAVISMFTTVFILAYALMKDKKEAIGYDRNMKDREIIKRLAPYLLRRKKLFILALALVLLSTVYSICAPAIPIPQATPYLWTNPLPIKPSAVRGCTATSGTADW